MPRINAQVERKRHQLLELDSYVVILHSTRVVSPSGLNMDLLETDGR